jgi:hypothetical protein
MFSEIERIGECFGVRREDIPAFITAIAEVVSRHMNVDSVEDWHGKVTTSEGRFK